MLAILPGLLTSLALIMAIGAQNAFVIRQGLTGKHMGLVIAVCAISDTALIFAGIAGLGALIIHLPILLEIARWFGVIYLAWFAIGAIRKALNTESMQVGEAQSGSAKTVLFTLLGFTFLNPHVYLDTVILLGSIGSQFGANKWFFGLGASLGSFLWFASIGLGAKAFAKYMSRPIFWRVLDGAIALVMFSLAIVLAFYNFESVK